MNEWENRIKRKKRKWKWKRIRIDSRLMNNQMYFINYIRLEGWIELESEGWIWYLD